jgi:predicted transcriptional regulator
MPKEKVMALYEEEKDISEMAKSFNVSESAMSFRLKSLNIEPIEFLS